jgi:hypothetical protein
MKKIIKSQERPGRRAEQRLPAMEEARWAWQRLLLA